METFEGNGGNSWWFGGKIWGYDGNIWWPDGRFWGLVDKSRALVEISIGLAVMPAALVQIIRWFWWKHLRPCSNIWRSGGYI